MSNKSSMLLSMFACLFFSNAAQAVSITVEEGEHAQIFFSFDGPSTTPAGDINFVKITGGGSLTYLNDVYDLDIQINLYDGDTLLGTGTINWGSSLFFGFVTPGSPWTNLFSADADLSSIVDGTIDGRLDFIPLWKEGQDAYIEKDIQILPGFSNSSGGQWFAPSPTINSVTISTVPVPAAVWLFISGLGLLGWTKHAAKRNLWGQRKSRVK